MTIHTKAGTTIDPREFNRLVTQFHAAPLHDGTGFEVSVIYATEPPHGHFTVVSVDDVAELVRRLRWK